VGRCPTCVIDDVPPHIYTHSCSTSAPSVFHIQSDLNQPTMQSTQSQPDAPDAARASESTTLRDAPQAQNSSLRDEPARMWGSAASHATGEPAAVLPGDLPPFDRVAPAEQGDKSADEALKAGTQVAFSARMVVAYAVLDFQCLAVCRR
jgi:hypothetical protein